MNNWGGRGSAWRGGGGRGWRWAGRGGGGRGGNSTAQQPPVDNRPSPQHQHGPAPAASIGQQRPPTFSRPQFIRGRGGSRGWGGARPTAPVIVGRGGRKNYSRPRSPGGVGVDDDGAEGGPPPKKARRRTSLKDGVIGMWRKKLPGYRLYYPASPPQLSEVDKKIQVISDYLQRKGYLTGDKLLYIDEKEYFEVICEDVIKDPLFQAGWSNFNEELVQDPGEVVNLWGAVMHKLVSEYLKSMLENENNLENGEDVGEIDVRGKEGKMVNNVGRIQAGLLKVEPITPVIRLNSSNLGKLVSIRGQIVRTGSLRAVCLQMAFLCKLCETEFLVDLPYGDYTFPTRCGVSEDCQNKRHFEPRENSERTLMVDCRKIKLQDIQNQDMRREAIPRTIECEMTNALATQCNTGDTVTICGIVKKKKETNYKGEQSLHSLYIEAIAIRNHREAERTMGGHWFSFSDKDYCAVREMFDTPDLFKILVASLCPSIYGHEFVKATLLLSLFGGSSHGTEILPRRSDINILMIGDPGIGKSQMLKIITDVAPRGVYVCGTGSTVAGLTVTLVKDGDDYTMEAGALVMSDRGVCCIDEFDKMVPQHPALLEAMEQQSVSIAKSGIFRTIPARTTVIAAANPVGGHYDQRKSLCENIKISAPLLSRFDVIFILLDKPNKEIDRKIIEHITKVFHKVSSGSGSNAAPTTSSSNRRTPPCSQQSFQQSSASFRSTRFIPLFERLKVKSRETLDLIPHPIMRKYIAYARQYVKPKLDAEANSIIKEYYLHLRVTRQMRDSTPITIRQLESLVRLTEARAKAELREIATAQDARDVLEIYESSLSSSRDDEVVAVSALSQSIIIGTGSSIGTGKNLSRNQAKRLVATLQSMAEQRRNNLFTTDEIRSTVKSLGLTTSSEQLIASLNNEGFLLKKGNGQYQLQTY